MTKEAFGTYLVIDPTGGGQLQIAMSSDLPETVDEERSLSEKAIRFFSNATPIAEMSDGVKAYSGILAAVLSTDLKLILIDEPDAFLHPPLARRLGSTLTTLASERDGNVLASTHDSKQKQEIPRLCRGGSRSLTFPGVFREVATDLYPWWQMGCVE
jgi:ABC-type multidrug transport system ATPase subunit